MELVVVIALVTWKQLVVFHQITKHIAVFFNLQYTMACYKVLVRHLRRQIDPTVHELDVLVRIQIDFAIFHLANSSNLSSEVLVLVLINEILKVNLIFLKALHQEPLVPQFVADAHVAVQGQYPFDIEVLLEILLLDHSGSFNLRR